MAVLKVITPGSQGKYHDENVYHDLICYIQNPQKVIHGYIGGFAVNPRNAAYEIQCLTAAYHKDFGGHLRHMVVSFQPGEIDTAATANGIAYQLAQYYGFRFQITWAVHENTDSLHIHFVMNRVSYLDGKKYEGDKADYYAFQNHARSVLRAYGLRFCIAS